jgi:hypothetical protein
MGQRKTPASRPGASGAPSERIPIDTNYPGFRCCWQITQWQPIFTALRKKQLEAEEGKVNCGAVT